VSGYLAPVKNTKTIVLTTYKRDGTAVGTPVSIAFDGDRAYFRSYHKAWKTKRLRNNPRVQVEPPTLLGRPTGPPIHARAILLEGEQARLCCKGAGPTPPPLASVLVPLAHRLMRYQTMHYELRPDPR
jgi:uncharacterized protein